MYVSRPTSRPFLADISGPVLLIQPGALGDSLLSLAVAGRLSKILETFPGLPIEMLGHLDYIRLFAGRSSITAASDIDTTPMHLLFADPPADLPKAFADYLSRFSAVITWLGAQGTPFAGNLASAVSGPAFFIDRSPPADYPHHVVRYWLSQLFDPPPPAEPHACRLCLSDQDISAADTELSKLLPWPIDTTDYFVFHPGAGSPAKCWPVDSFVQLAQLITARTDYRVVYLLGPTERERFSRDTFALLSGTGHVLVDLDISLVAALIHRSRGFLGHDSGPTHLASALGVPTVAIFGPTNPIHWQPLGPIVRLISAANDSPLTAHSLSIDSVYSTIRDMID
jgi:hypothetical protein